MSHKQSTRVHWTQYWNEHNAKEVKRQFNPILISRLQRALGGLQGRRVLEAGCGTALDTIELARRGAISFAYDYSDAAHRLASKNARFNDVELLQIQGDILRLPFRRASFDAIFHAGVLEHFHDPIEVLVEQKRVLVPGGILLVDVPQTYNLYTLRKSIALLRGSWFAGWETQYSIRQLESLLRSAGFEILDTYGYGYYPALFSKVRWASDIGRGIIGRPFMPAVLTNRYIQLWTRFEQTRAFLYFSHNIGVVSKRL